MSTPRPTPPHPGARPAGVAPEGSDAAGVAPEGPEAAGFRRERPESAVFRPDGPAPSGRPRRRIALWSGLGVFVVFAVFLAFLATVGSAADNSPLLGKPAPGVSGRELATGRPIALDDFAGKWVLVNFAASWCIPCQEEMPQLEQFSAAAPRYDATVLTVTYDPGDTSGLRAMLAGDHARWPGVADAEAQVRWGLKGIPQSFLVSPAGTVVAFWASGVQATGVESAISKLASSPAAASAS